MTGTTGYAVPLKRPAVDVKRLEDGGYIFRSPYGVRASTAHAGTWLRSWAQSAPDRPFLIEKGARGRKRLLTYGQALQSVVQLAAALSEQAKSPRRTVVALADNSIDTALVHLAAAEAGLPLITPDPDAVERGNGAAVALKSLLAASVPAVVYVDSGERRSTLIDLAAEAGATVVVGSEPTGKAIELKKWIKKAAKGPDPHATPPAVAVAGALRIYFDGEIIRGVPGMVLGARGLAANLDAVASLLPPPSAPFPLAAGKTPWWRPAGAWALHAVLRAGGTYHIDEATKGVQLTQLFLNAAQLARLADAPKRFTTALEQILILDGTFDLALAARIQEHAVKARGQRIPLMWGYGATGTGTMDSLLYFETETPRNLGLPTPGTLLKLAPVGAEFELRVKPAGEPPQAWDNGQQTARALDADGFLGTGDSAKLIDPMRPFLGLQWIDRLRAPLI